MTSNPPLAIQGLAVTADDDRTVLDNLSLTLHPGEILGIVAQRGAGLSLLLKTILTAAIAKSGDIRVFSAPHDLPESQAQLAYLPGSLQTPGHLTGCDVVTMARTVKGKAVGPIEELAADLGLPMKRLNYPTRNYSQEDMQKLALLTLFAMQRPILLLDRAMTALSGDAKIGLGRRLRAHARNGGGAIIGADSPADLMEIADRTLLLEGGSLHPIHEQTRVTSAHEASVRWPEDGMVAPRNMSLS